MRCEGRVEAVSNTLTVIFEACGRQGRYEEGCEVHALVMHMGFESDAFLSNSVITMYSRLGYVDAACKLFQIMDIKDVVSWNSIIAGYVQAEKIEEAYRHFQKMPQKDIVSWTTMITGFSSKGFTGKSVELFNMMPEKDDVAWTALISGFVTNGEYEEAIYWFIKMLQKAVKPNQGFATLNQGMQMHAHVVKLRMAFELSIQNSLVSMYSKCGTAGDAYSIFLSISAPNVVSLNFPITGFAQNGLGKEALDLFKKMLDLNLEPNEITFLGVLSACTHVGLVEEGWFYFRSMRSLYNIEQGPDHYACMVDLLGRASLMDEELT